LKLLYHFHHDGLTRLKVLGKVNVISPGFKTAPQHVPGAGT
jgi:hypothetical protein